jgi:hypothetical protein
MIEGSKADRCSLSASPAIICSALARTTEFSDSTLKLPRSNLNVGNTQNTREIHLNLYKRSAAEFPGTFSLVFGAE